MKEINFFDFDLDIIPENRWKHIFDAFEEKIPELKKNINKIIVSYGSLSDIGDIFIKLIPNSKILYYQELSYIAKRIGLSIFEILILQLTYEISSACTTAIFEIGDEKFFLRTMDWPLQFLKDITIGLRIIRNNLVIAQVTTWLGYVGFLTVTNIINNCSYAVNYRRTSNLSFISIIKNLVRILNMNWPIGYLIRFITEVNIDLHTAIELLSTTQLISPCYITIYAPNDKSCILTRDCNKLDNIRYNNLVQTNCDHDKIEPNILWSLERIALIKKVYWKLKNKKNKFFLSSKKLLKSFLREPVLNNQTIYIHYQYGNEFKSLV